MKNLEKDATNPTKKPKKVITRIIEIFEAVPEDEEYNPNVKVALLIIVDEEYEKFCHTQSYSLFTYTKIQENLLIFFSIYL